ncbi:hypothetical protein JCM6882_002611 [Rhodosporidiobolus microsporus]
MSSLLSNGLVQTALVFASPLLVPKALRLVQRFLNPAPKGKRTSLGPGVGAAGRPPPPPDDPRYAALRLFVLALGVSVAIFTALSPPHNLFLSLSPPHSLPATLFPLLRPPLDLRLASQTLANLWQTSLSRPLSEADLALLQRLQTLDARLAYIAYGAGPLMTCSWCRPPGTATAAGLLGTDYLLAAAPGIAVVYLSVLAATGVLLSGNGRKRWRKWAVGVTVAAAAWEVWERLTWDGARGGIGGTVTMLHSKLHLLRSLFALALLLAAYFAPPQAPPHAPSTAQLVAPPIVAVTQQAESVLHKLRALSMLRMAVLHSDETREKVTSFWSSASAESTLARSSPAVQSLLQAEELRSAVGPFRAWVEGAMGAPGVRVEQEGEEEEEEEEEEGGKEGGGPEEGAEDEREGDRLPPLTA